MSQESYREHHDGLSRAQVSPSQAVDIMTIECGYQTGYRRDKRIETDCEVGELGGSPRGLQENAGYPGQSEHKEHCGSEKARLCSEGVDIVEEGLLQGLTTDCGSHNYLFAV